MRSRSYRGHTSRLVTLALFAPALALSLHAQRLDDAVIGASRRDAELPRRQTEVDSARNVTSAVTNAGIADTTKRSPNAGAPDFMRAPERRCADIGPFVTATILSAVLLAPLLAGLGLVNKSRDYVIPVVLITAAAVGIVAGVCNR
jgi:hypothetical protein